MLSGTWFDDFEFKPGLIRYRKTGVAIDLRTRDNRAAMWRLGCFYIQSRLATPLPGERFNVAFTPDQARPWYLIWPSLRLAGARFVKDPAEADLVVHFQDATEGPALRPAGRVGAKYINFNCPSVSKTRISTVFEEVFGYPLLVDPRTYTGRAVEKGEINGAHDGRIVECPTEPVAGKVYQRLVDNRTQNGLVEDLRAPTLAGVPACVFLKRRPVDQRFANMNTEVDLAAPHDVFSPIELRRIGEFCRRLGLDWGGLDVLRDQAEGKLYIVDANKTDMGPPTALAARKKIDAVRLLAAALRNFVFSAAN